MFLFKLRQNLVKVKLWISLEMKSEAISLANQITPRLTLAKLAKDLVPACFSLDNPLVRNI